MVGGLSTAGGISREVAENYAQDVGERAYKKGQETLLMRFVSDPEALSGLLERTPKETRDAALSKFSPDWLARMFGGGV